MASARAGETGSSETRRVVAIWAMTAALALAAAAALAEAPLALVAAAVLAAISTLLVAAFSEPRWALLVQLALLFGYVVDVLRETAGIPATTETLVILVILSVLFRQLLGVEAVEFPGREAALFGALLALMAISTVLAAFDRVAAFDEILDIAENAIVVVLVIVLLDTVQWIRRAAWLLAGVGGVLGALAAFQQLSGAYSMTFGGFSTVALDYGVQRSAGPHNVNVFGQMLVFAALLALYLFLGARGTRAAPLALALFAGAAGGLFFTYSRGSLLAFAAALGLTAVLRKARIWLPAAVGAAIILVGGMLLSDAAKDRFGSLVAPTDSGIATAEDASIRGRFSENVAAILMFVDHPLLGVGPANYPAHYLDYSKEIGIDPRAEERSAHNLYLESLAELGALGTAVVLAIFWAAIAGARRARAALEGRDALLAEGILVALVGVLCNAIFLHPAYARYVWIPVALALAVGHLPAVRARS